MAEIILSGQNIDIYEGDGLDSHARTGATSAEQIHNAGAQGVILGHSEVGDTPEQVRGKLLALVNKGEILPRSTILVGETWEEFENQSVLRVAGKVFEQLSFILSDIPKRLIQRLVIGYEPKWGSRGSGRDDMPPPAPEIISATCLALRDCLDSMHDELTSVPIIYGGRSTPERTREILADKNIDGFILGSASNSVEKTIRIAKAMKDVRPDGRKILHANFKAYNVSDTYQAYIDTLRSLDDTFVVYLSPCHADIREVKALL